MSALSKWFKTGYEEVQKYSEELDRKQAEARSKRSFIPNLILRDGESTVIRFLTDEPVTFREHYLPNAQGRKFYTCLAGVEENGEAVECPFCSAGNKPSFRGAYLVIDRGTDTWVDKDGKQHTAQNQIKIFKHGIKVLKVLDKIRSKRELTEWDIEVSRTGSGTDTSYNFIPEESYSLTDQEKEQIREFKGDKTLLDVLIEEIKPVTFNEALIVLGESRRAPKNDSGIGF